MSFDRLRLVAVNALIAAILFVVVIDALPLSPPTLRDAVQPIVQRVGLHQWWNVFAPPDSVNTRWRAEITYRDGRTATWRSPPWSQLSVFQRYAGHRHEEWRDNSWGGEDSAVWRGWARYLARTQRPDLADADRGAEVKIIKEDALIRPAELKPWTTWRSEPKFDQVWTLTTVKLP